MFGIREFSFLTDLMGYLMRLCLNMKVFWEGIHSFQVFQVEPFWVF